MLILFVYKYLIFTTQISKFVDSLASPGLSLMISFQTNNYLELKFQKAENVNYWEKMNFTFY
jgi:hypothetical protein